MQTIADLLTGAMKVYGEENLSGARATDVLVAAIREGKLEPTTLAGALSQVLPFAQEVGVEFHEVAGALAAMSKQNIGAERGATALRGVFNKIIRPTEMARKEMQSYGIDIDEIRQIIREKGLPGGAADPQDRVRRQQRRDGKGLRGFRSSPGRPGPDE